jgi:hydroxymethylglutaryl-CoA lyase
MEDSITLVEVGMRDGFQSVGPFIPTSTKIEILNHLYNAGIRRVEATSMVSKVAIPQLADAQEIINASNSLPDLSAQILVPKAKHAELALKAGANHLAFVLSISNEHNQSNVRQSPEQSIAEYAAIVSMLKPDQRLRLNIATAFDCPFRGKLHIDESLAILDELVQLAPFAEIALCDTTGRVTPDHVELLFKTVQRRYPEILNWVFHGHDTYGLGIANVYSAWLAGIRIFDASFAGLGGCPFAPGATGNVASEDVLFMFQKMDVKTGIDFESFLRVANQIATLPGANLGGKIRELISTAP